MLNNWGMDTLDAGVPANWSQDRPVGIIDQDELNRVLNNLGSSTAAEFGAGSIPEPGAAAVRGSLGALSMMRR